MSRTRSSALTEIGKLGTLSSFCLQPPRQGHLLGGTSYGVSKVVDTRVHRSSFSQTRVRQMASAWTRCANAHADE